MAQAHKFRKGKSLFATTLTTGIGTGTGDTITLNSTSGLPTDTEITLTFGRVDSDGTVRASNLVERITGVISGSTLTAYTRGIDGTTEQSHASGTVVEYIWNADDLNDIVDGILAQHSQAGAHTAITATSVNIGSTVTVTGFVDEDNMASDSATALATQQSIKAYVDTEVAGVTVGPRILLTPLAATFPAANFPQLVKNVGTNAVDFTLDYDKATDETADWCDVPIPAGITINSATAYFTFRTTVTTGTVQWAITIKSNAEDEAWDAAGTTDTADAETVQGTAGDICQVSKALTTTTWAAGESLHIRVFRDVSGDDADADAKLMNVLIVIS